MITRRAFVEKVDEIDAEQPTYRKRGYGKDGTCDCIGLGIGALRRAGEKWPGTHGSNYAARQETHDLHRITSAADLQTGDVVYKGKEKGESGWNLPKTYRAGDDQTDYYHFGIVRGVDPLDIVHCTSPTVKHDHKLGDWNYTGKFNRVEDTWRENEEESMAKEALIDRPAGTKGSTVNIRKSADKSSALVDRIAFGETVEVIVDAGEWCQIKRKDGLTGWIMSNYILYSGEDVTNEEQGITQKDTETLQKAMLKLSQLESDAEEIGDLIASVVGRG